MTDKLYVGQAVHVNLADLFVHEYHCEHCEQACFVAVECAEIQTCDDCGAIKRKVSDEPLCLADLVWGD